MEIIVLINEWRIFINNLTYLNDTLQHVI